MSQLSSRKSERRPLQDSTNTFINQQNVQNTSLDKQSKTRVSKTSQELQDDTNTISSRATRSMSTRKSLGTNDNDLLPLTNHTSADNRNINNNYKSKRGFKFAIFNDQEPTLSGTQSGDNSNEIKDVKRRRRSSVGVEDQVRKPLENVVDSSVVEIENIVSMPVTRRRASLTKLSETTITTEKPVPDDLENNQVNVENTSSSSQKRKRRSSSGVISKKTETALFKVPVEESNSSSSLPLNDVIQPVESEPITRRRSSRFVKFQENKVDAVVTDKTDENVKQSGSDTLKETRNSTTEEAIATVVEVEVTIESAESLPAIGSKVNDETTAKVEIEIPLVNSEEGITSTDSISETVKEDSEVIDSASTASSSCISEESEVAVEEEASIEVPVFLVKVPPTADLRTVPTRMSANPADCHEILNDMYDIYYAQAPTYAATPYMTMQKDITEKMRCILIDWIVEVHYKFNLNHASLWLTVNIIDRYLAKVKVSRLKLQLVGVSAFLIACKFEDKNPPTVKDCVYITDNAYDKREILQMESLILLTLDYQVFVPTGYHFLRRYLNAINASDQVKYFAFYYAERNLQEYYLTSCIPHEFAAGAVYAALYKMSESIYSPFVSYHLWNQRLLTETKLSEYDTRRIAYKIIGNCQVEKETVSKRRLIAAKKKFSSDRYDGVAKATLPKIPQPIL